MKEIKTFRLSIDGYRRPSRQRNTKGLYYVGAKTEKEAIELLQTAIKFGSIEPLGTVSEKANPEIKMQYKQIKKGITILHDNQAPTYILIDPHAATERQKFAEDQVQEAEQVGKKGV
jgi:hypothetical protein